MTREEFLKGIQEQFDDTDVNLINFETKFRELEEWSSMMALIIIAFIDERFSKTLSGDDFKKCITIEDLFQLLNNS
jgi:acyl carrier protein